MICELFCGTMPADRSMTSRSACCTRCSTGAWSVASCEHLCLDALSRAQIRGVPRTARTYAALIATAGQHWAQAQPERSGLRSGERRDMHALSFCFEFLRVRRWHCQELSFCTQLCFASWA